MKSSDERPDWVPQVFCDTFRLWDGRIIRVRGGRTAGFLAIGSKYDEVDYADVLDEQRGWVPCVNDIPVSEIKEPCPDPSSPWLM